MIDKKSRTIGRSFRVDEQWLNVLNEEAKREGISVNALMNQILQDYSLFHRYFKRHPGIVLMQKSFSRIIEKCPKEDLIEIGREAGAIIVKDVFRIFGLSPNHKDVTFYLLTMLAKYGNWFEYEHHTRNNKEFFHLRHDLGENGSIYIGEFVSAIFEHSLNKKIKTEITAGTLTFEVPLN